MRKEVLHTTVPLHEVLLPLFSKNILGLIIQPLIYLFCNLKPSLPQCAGQPPERPLESLDGVGGPRQKYMTLLQPWDLLLQE